MPLSPYFRQVLFKQIVAPFPISLILCNFTPNIAIAWLSQWYTLPQTKNPKCKRQGRRPGREGKSVLTAAGLTGREGGVGRVYARGKGGGKRTGGGLRGGLGRKGKGWVEGKEGDGVGVAGKSMSRRESNKQTKGLKKQTLWPELEALNRTVMGLIDLHTGSIFWN